MNSYEDTLIKIDILYFYRLSPGRSLLLTNDMIGYLEKVMYLVDKSKKEDTMTLFFQNYTELLRYKNEREIAEMFLNKLYDSSNIRIGGFERSTASYLKDKEFRINIKNLDFFNKNLWPILVEKIVKNEVFLKDYAAPETKIMKFAVSTKALSYHYPSWITREECIELFLDDLQKWLFFNVLEIKEVEIKEGKPFSKVIVTI